MRLQLSTNATVNATTALLYMQQTAARAQNLNTCSGV